MVRGLGKERGLGEFVWAGSPRIGPLGGSERSWTLRTARHLASARKTPETGKRTVVPETPYRTPKN